MLLRYLLPLLLACLVQASAHAQSDTPAVFKRIMAEMKDFRPDTSAPPDDKVTQAIVELRSLRGGFNVAEAIQFKLQEDRQKGDITPAELDRVAAFFRDGAGKRRLDNAVIHIYRQRFSYEELQQLVAFYKTPAGRKLADDFPLIMLQAAAAAEMIKAGLNPQSHKTDSSR